jgi:pimeloyl-ACP methyl ester carboxylesterase
MKRAILLVLLLAASQPAATAPTEPEEKFTPTGILAVTSKDGSILRGQIFDFGRAKTSPTLFVLAPLGTPARGLHFFLKEAKAQGLRVVLADPRGQGMSMNTANGTKLSWHNFDKKEFEKFPDDLALMVAQQQRPLFIMGFDQSATLAMLAAEKTVPDGLILFSPDDHLRELMVKPSAMSSTTAVFAVAGNEDSQRAALLLSWKEDFPRSREAPVVITDTGSGIGLSSFQTSTNLRKKIWQWLATVARKK